MGQKQQKKPTWQNTLRCSTTSAYSLTSHPAQPGCPSPSHPTSQHISMPLFYGEERAKQVHYLSFPTGPRKATNCGDASLWPVARGIPCHCWCRGGKNEEMPSFAPNHPFVVASLSAAIGRMLAVMPYKFQTLFLDGASYSIACSRAMKTSDKVILSIASSVQPYRSLNITPSEARNTSKVAVSVLITPNRSGTLSVSAVDCVVVAAFMCVHQLIHRMRMPVIRIIHYCLDHRFYCTLQLMELCHGVFLSRCSVEHVLVP